MLTGQIGFHILLPAANQTPAPVGLSALLDSPFQVEPGTSRLPAPPAPLVGALLEGVARWRLGGWMIVGPLCVQVFLKQFSCLWFSRVSHSASRYVPAQVWKGG